MTGRLHRASIGGERCYRAAADLRWLLGVAACLALLGLAGICWIMAGRAGLL